MHIYQSHILVNTITKTSFAINYLKKKMIIIVSTFKLLILIAKQMHASLVIDYYFKCKKKVMKQSEMKQIIPEND